MAATQEVTELRAELERLSRELDQASSEKIQSAQYGLGLLEEKSLLQQKCEELETLYDNTRHELDITQEVGVRLLSLLRCNFSSSSFSRIIFLLFYPLFVCTSILRIGCSFQHPAYTHTHIFSIAYQLKKNSNAASAASKMLRAIWSVDRCLVECVRANSAGFSVLFALVLQPLRFGRCSQ